MDRNMDKMADYIVKSVCSTENTGYNEVQHWDIEAYHIWYEIPCWFTFYLFAETYEDIQISLKIKDS